jgi:cell division septum initiation protein DivIVA
MSKLTMALAELAKRADAGDEAARQGIRAYHGSPHSFDKFSTSQIGTGEGAQAFGHGLYFAEEEAVAKAYRDALKGNIVTTSDGVTKTYGQHITEVEDAIRAAHPNLNPDNIRAAAKSVVDDNLTDADVEGMGQWEGVYKSGIVANKNAQASKGSMYEVKIDAAAEDFLNWQTPLREQKKLLSALDDQYGDHEIVLQQLGLDIKNETPTGGDLAMALGMTRGGQTAPPRLLTDAGLKGVKYPAAFTRQKSPDKQSFNYVVFDDKLIDITKKYGVSILAAAVIADGIMTPEEAQAGFIGPTSKIFINEAANLAKSMDAAGNTRDEIWKATGEQFGAPMLKGPEGVWKQEISDQGNYIPAEQEAGLRQGRTPTFGAALQGPDGPSSMVEAYPRLQDSRITPIVSDTTRGSFNPRSGDIRLSTGDSLVNRSNEEMASTLQHEGQHFIQEQENWAKGGNPEHSARMLDAAKQDLVEAQEKAQSVRMQYEDKLEELGYRNAIDLSRTAYKLSEVDRLKGYLDGYYNGGKLTDKRRHILNSGSVMDPNAEYRMRMDINWAKRHRPQAERDQNYADYIQGVIAAVEKDMDPQLVEQVRNSGVKNPYAKYQREISNARAKAQEAFGVDMETWNGTVAEMNQFVNRYERGGGEKLYRDLAGEVEARTVQERLPMSMDERIASPPWEGQEWTNTPPEKQVFIDDYGRLATATMGGMLAGAASTAGASDGGMGVRMPPAAEDEEAMLAPTGGDLMQQANRDFAGAIRTQPEPDFLTGVQQSLLSGIMKTAGVADLSADVVSAMAGPLLSAPGAIARYAADRYVPGVNYSAEEMAQGRRETEDYFNYQPRTELGPQYGEQIMQGIGGAIAPYVPAIKKAAGDSYILGAMRQGYDYLGDKEKMFVEALGDIFSPI